MASKGVNKVILVGNLGQDPEVRFMPNGNAVANISIATSESWKDQQGQLQEKTEWHRVVMFRRLAEIAGEYLKKGSQVYLEGKLQTRKWQDQQGQDKYTTEIVADQMQMLGGRTGGGQGQPQGGGFQPQQQSQPAQQQQPQYQQYPGGQNQQAAPASAPQQNNGGFNQQQGGFSQQAAQSPAPQQNQAPASAPASKPMGEPDFDFDDDIPF